MVSDTVYTGMALSQIPLTGGEANVSGRFVWIDPSATAVYGENIYDVSFIPNDTVIYTQVVGISATFTAVNRSTGGGSGGGSSSRGDATTTVSEKQSGQLVAAVVSLTATVGEDGHGLVSIIGSTVADAIQKAMKAAKSQGKATNGIGVSIMINTPPNAKSLDLVLTQPVLKQFVDGKVQEFEVNGQILTLNLNQEAIKEIQKQSTADVTITVEPVYIKDVRNAYDITISFVKDDKTVNITSLGNGRVTLAIPCTPGKNEVTAYLYAVYVDPTGKVTRIPGSAYDANSRSVIFTTKHLAVYGVGYEVPSAKFRDMSSQWAKKSIDYVVWRGIFSGNGIGKFSPAITMLHRYIKLRCQDNDGV